MNDTLETASSQSVVFIQIEEESGVFVSERHKIQKRVFQFQFKRVFYPDKNGLAVKHGMIQCLDIGCGIGSVMADLAKTGADLTGVTIAQNEVEMGTVYLKIHSGII